ncbi:hypothetical protein B0A48_12864 [Cryoendolithus antarcticus]|uniref:Seipin n=1 Tax=Cryoendolithus antarcticus TaxID=1507870 RepID=A0A1V8SQP8_9PEZI|nr:hypothetical protein B0A48_12864 [Cryoendolithus antarcticus]
MALARPSKGETDDDEKGLIASTIDLALTPIRPFVSRPALRTYLKTFLLLSTALVLFAAACTAYATFYWNYVPALGFEREAWLQFDDVHGAFPGTGGERGGGDELFKATVTHPWAEVDLREEVASQQGYDVVVEVTLPRTQGNREAGNWMLDVSLLAFPTRKSGDSEILARSRRPAIMTYRSSPTELVHRLASLPRSLVSTQQSEAETLVLPIFDQVSFPKGSTNLPSTLRLELQSPRRLEIYSVLVKFRARFRGLRWLMYNHRILSAFIFISAFWGVEVVVAGIVWLLIASKLGGRSGITSDEKPERRGRVKHEQDDDDDDGVVGMSDTERQFPTLSSQAPLRYRAVKDEGPGVVKIEAEEEISAQDLRDALPVGVEADDEDEDADLFLDSGIGTSLESSNTRPGGSVRKRRSRDRGPPGPVGDGEW